MLPALAQREQEIHGSEDHPRRGRPQRSQSHGVTRIEFREQIHMIKRNENLRADFNLSFGPTGDVWNPRIRELIGSIVHGP